MTGEYVITSNEKPVGKATVSRQGLYYRFSCQCQKTPGIWKAAVRCGSKTVLLGTCIPDGAVLKIEKKVAAKELGDGVFSVVLLSGEEKQGHRAVPLYEDRRFEALSKLPYSRFGRINGQPAVLYASNEISSSTGQWSEPRMSE